MASTTISKNDKNDSNAAGQPGGLSKGDPTKVILAVVAVAIALALAYNNLLWPTSLLETNDFDVIAALVDAGVPSSLLSPALVHSGPEAACSVLLSTYGPDFVDLPDQEYYTAFKSQLWSSFQSDVNPACIFKPHTEKAVAVAVLLARLTNTTFAAKSGGHAAFKGASNAQNGITISFQNLDGIELNGDKSIASIQPGNTWSKVYTRLAEDDLVVIGGRVHDIGIGGLTTGGGISFFSSHRGWACDNVESYRVVTADGQLITASAEENPDLFWALRGGGNNFGLVVQFNYRTFPLPGGLLWGGSRVHVGEDLSRITDAFHHFTQTSGDDHNAGAFISFAVFDKTPLVQAEVFYTNTSGADASPVLNGFFEGVTPVHDSSKVQLLAEYTKTLSGDLGYNIRQAYHTMTVEADSELLHSIREIFFSSVAGKPIDVRAYLPVINIQAITTPMLEEMSKNGGNALGLTPDRGPLMIILMAHYWSRDFDDEAEYAFVDEVLAKITAEAKKRGKHHDFLYMNYGGWTQDVVASYGPDNVRRLVAISEKYDPHRVFQKLQPGYFKLEGGSPQRHAQALTV